MSDDKRHLDESWLREKYVEEGYSAPQIANMVNKHPQTIYGAMRRFGIERRAHLAGKEPGNDESVLQKKLERDNEYRRGQLRQLKNSLSCQECGVEEDAVLEFHHTDENEHHLYLAQMADALSDGELKRELKRGKILCANCHARHHYSQ